MRVVIILIFAFLFNFCTNKREDEFINFSSFNEYKLNRQHHFERSNYVVESNNVRNTLIKMVDSRYCDFFNKWGPHDNFEFVIDDFLINSSADQYFAWFIWRRESGSEVFYEAASIVGYKGDGNRWKNYLFDYFQVTKMRDMNKAIQVIRVLMHRDFSEISLTVRNSELAPNYVIPVGVKIGDDNFWNSPLWSKDYCLSDLYIFEYRNLDCSPLNKSNILEPFYFNWN